MNRNILIISIIFMFIALFGCSEQNHIPKTHIQGAGEEVKGTNYPVSLIFPDGWRVDVQTDYCEMIAYGPDETYVILSVYPAQGMTRQEHMMKMLQTFSFYEQFRVLEDSMYLWGKTEGGYMIYTYGETSQNESFIEYTFYKQDEQYFYLLQMVSPSVIFDSYKDVFGGIAATLKTGL